jgi:gliding motility-associated protein GldM
MTQDQISIAERVDGEKGSVQLSLPASSTGTKKYAGLIEMTNPFGDKNYYHFKQSYLVAEPSATISPTKMNVFYRGVDNPVAISASGKADSQLDVRMTNGKISRTDTGWVVNDLPQEAYETTISIYADDDGGKKFMGEQKFRVKRLPDPIARVIGANEDNKISKARLTSNPYLLCTLPEYVDFKYDFKVTSFTMIIPTRGGSQLINRAKAEGMMFTDEMKSMINNTRSDDIIIFQDISVRGPEGPRRIKGINITIQ